MIMKTYVSIVLRTKTQAVTILGCLFVSPFVISSFSERGRGREKMGGKGRRGREEERRGGKSKNQYVNVGLYMSNMNQVMK